MSTTPKRYSLEMLFNGITIKKRPTDIEKAIMDAKPEVLLTDMFITIKHGNYIIERHLNLKQGKQIFNDDLSREIFINNLLLT